MQLESVEWITAGLAAGWTTGTITAGIHDAINRYLGNRHLADRQRLSELLATVRTLNAGHDCDVVWVDHLPTKATVK